MEDGLGDLIKCTYETVLNEVLILVLVEDGLGVKNGNLNRTPPSVLILVLVEDGLGGLPQRAAWLPATSLNPCFSGGWSRRVYNITLSTKYYCLNPCFSGGWSRRI